MLCKSALLAAAFVAMAAVDAADIEAQLLKKVVEYEANKAAEAVQLAEIKQLLASMSAASPAVEPIQASALSAQASTGSGSGAGKGGKSTPTVGSGSDDFSIETPPVLTSRPPATEAPAKSGSAASSETVKTPTPAPSTKSAAVAIEMVAPAAVAVAAAAFTLF